MTTPDDWWADARERALAGLDARVHKLITTLPPRPPGLSHDQIRQFIQADSEKRVIPALEALKRQRGRVLDPRWLPRRPPRRMPSLWTIASHWHAREGNPLLLDAEAIEFPYCFACAAMAPAIDESRSLAARWNGASRWLDRAHLVDRVFGGLDGAQNLVPLCYPCHRVMPAFRIEQADGAIEWIIAGGKFATVRECAGIVRAGSLESTPGTS